MSATTSRRSRSCSRRCATSRRSWRRGHHGRLRPPRRPGQHRQLRRRAGTRGRAARGRPGRGHRARRVAGLGDDAGLARRARPAGRDPRGRSLPLLARAAFAELGRRSPRACAWRLLPRMRRRTGLLMDGGEPGGGRWNFDPENRKAPAEGPRRCPSASRFPPDAMTREVIAARGAALRRSFRRPRRLRLAGDPRRRARGASSTSSPSACPPSATTRTRCARGAPFLYHALIAPALNAGLLTAGGGLPARRSAPTARATAPLNCVEGFIRQILGWREYVRGVYWARMPDYAATNALEATRDLPWFYWSGETAMNCLAQCVADTRAPRLRPPHPAPDGDGQLRAARRRSRRRRSRNGTCRLRRRLRVGRAAQRPRHGAVGRRRRDGLEALRGVGRLHQPDVGLLPRLRLRRGAEGRAGRPARSTTSTGTS